MTNRKKPAPQSDVANIMNSSDKILILTRDKTAFLFDDTSGIRHSIQSAVQSSTPPAFVRVTTNTHEIFINTTEIACVKIPNGPAVKIGK